MLWCCWSGNRTHPQNIPWASLHSRPPVLYAMLPVVQQNSMTCCMFSFIQTTGPSNADKEASKQTAVKLKGPTTKLQLMQPGQLQRKSFALGRGKGVTPSQTGPLKAPHPSKAKMGDTVERPCELDCLAWGGGSQACVGVCMYVFSHLCLDACLCKIPPCTL